MSSSDCAGHASVDVGDNLVLVGLTDPGEPTSFPLRLPIIGDFPASAAFFSSEIGNENSKLIRFKRFTSVEILLGKCFCICGVST